MGDLEEEREVVARQVDVPQQAHPHGAHRRLPAFGSVGLISIFNQAKLSKYHYHAKSSLRHSLDTVLPFDEWVTDKALILSQVT